MSYFERTDNLEVIRKIKPRIIQKAKHVCRPVLQGNAVSIDAGEKAKCSEIKFTQ